MNQANKKHQISRKAFHPVYTFLYGCLYGYLLHRIHHLFITGIALSLLVPIIIFALLIPAIIFFLILNNKHLPGTFSKLKRIFIFSLGLILADYIATLLYLRLNSADMKTNPPRRYYEIHPDSKN